jgi:hypothetical protein
MISWIIDTHTRTRTHTHAYAHKHKHTQWNTSIITVLKLYDNFHLVVVYQLGINIFQLGLSKVKK